MHITSCLRHKYLELLMSMSHDKESYMHYYAKSILEEWLISAWNYNKQHGYDNKLYIFEWKIDCSINNCGVRLEYPILSKQMADGTTTTLLGVSHAWHDYPDLDKLAAGVKVEVVLDVAIIENGALKYGIEVVHKHACSKKKREFLTLHRSKFKVYEISAEWILSQVRSNIPPKKLPLIAAA
jgi:hypothetical protein